MGGRTIVTYLITTLTAVTIGLILVNVIQPGKSISVDTRQELVEAYSSDTKAKQEAAAKQQEAGPLQALIDVVPSNIFLAASQQPEYVASNLFCIVLWNWNDFATCKKGKTSQEVFRLL